MNLSPIEIGLLMIGLFFVLLYLKMPIGASLLIPAFTGFCMIRGLPVGLSSLGVIIWKQGVKEVLLLIPLFTFMGLLAGQFGISKDAFSALYKWVGHLPGGLAMACTGACAAFGAVCGNNLATSLTMTSVALPEMRKYKYSDQFSIGCIAASGNLGIMIPPSGSFIFYGFLTETSIGALFIAGILPGLLIMFAFWIQMYIQCKLNPALGPAGPWVSWLERLKSTRGLLAIFFVFLMVMGGIYAGVFTPNEGASCGVFTVFLVGLFTRQVKWKLFVSALQETILISSMIMFMIIGAMYFGSFMAISQIPTALAGLITSLGVNPYLIMLSILLVYFLGGCLMDLYPLLAVTLPIFYPIVLKLGFDPLQFGVLCVLVIMVGSISPPFGMQIFALGGVYQKVPIHKIFRGVIPFIVTMAVCLVILLLLLPSLSTMLPNCMLSSR